jgi:hypothetical protein
MKLKFLLFCISFQIIHILLFCNDNKKEVTIQESDNTHGLFKAFDISIGGGILFSNFNIQISKDSYNTKLKIFQRGFPDKSFYMSIGLSLPLSFTYFFKPSHAIGFNIQIGYMITPFFSYFIWHDIFLYTSLKYKFGKQEKRTRFIIETGYLMSYELIYYAGYDEYINTILSYLYLGPKLLIGLEYHYNKFSFEFGGYIGVSFDVINNYLADYHYFSNYYHQFRRYQSIFFGFEFRYNFYYSKKIK